MAYKNAAVGHLAWSLLSEPLAYIPGTQSLVIPDSPLLHQWLKQLDDNPAALETYLAQQNSRLLGSYFECLWQFFFLNHPHWQLLAHHVQVFDGKQTLGELDIVAQATKQAPIHIELAVKFYLLKPNAQGDELAHWLGPQSRDRLDLKLGTLEHKQLPFLHHHATQATLEQQGLTNNLEQALALKGYLFLPWPSADYAFHEYINPNVNQGYWLHVSASDELCDATEQWVILPKSHWLGPYQHNLQSTLDILNTQQAKDALAAHFNHHPHPYALMLVKLNETLTELQRYLIVKDQWPSA